MERDSQTILRHVALYTSQDKDSQTFPDRSLYLHTSIKKPNQPSAGLSRSASYSRSLTLVALRLCQKTGFDFRFPWTGSKTVNRKSRLG